jgi:hypothetical protein
MDKCIEVGFSPATAAWASQAACSAGLVRDGEPDFARLALLLIRQHEIDSLDDVSALAEAHPLASEFLMKVLRAFAIFDSRSQLSTEVH